MMAAQAEQQRCRCSQGRVLLHESRNTQRASRPSGAGLGRWSPAARPTSSDAAAAAALSLQGARPRAPPLRRHHACSHAAHARSTRRSAGVRAHVRARCSSSSLRAAACMPASRSSTSFWRRPYWRSTDARALCRARGQGVAAGAAPARQGRHMCGVAGSTWGATGGCKEHLHAACGGLREDAKSTCVQRAGGNGRVQGPPACSTRGATGGCKEHLRAAPGGCGRVQGTPACSTRGATGGCKEHLRAAPGGLREGARNTCMQHAGGYGRMQRAPACSTRGAAGGCKEHLHAARGRLREDAKSTCVQHPGGCGRVQGTPACSTRGATGGCKEHLRAASRKLQEGAKNTCVQHTGGCGRVQGPPACKRRSRNLCVEGGAAWGVQGIKESLQRTM